jgi:hypothetical protein
MKTPDDLNAVDEALASGRADAPDPTARELQEIALTLRADAPEADPAFAARLDERVARRFARARQARRFLPSRRLALAGAAGLVTVVAAAGAVAGISGGGGSEPAPMLAKPVAGSGAGQEQVEEQAARDASGGTALFDGNVADEAKTRLATGGRRVEHTAQLKLAAPPDELDDVADRIVDVTDRHRGVVINSSVSTGADSGHGGSFALRVPTAELNETLRELSRLGEVRERSQFEQDVTRQYSTTTDRLASARLERRGLQRRLAHATTTAEGDRLRARIDSLAHEIHSLRGELGRLRVRTDFTKLSVTLVERERAASPIGGAGDALNGSLRALVEAVAVTLRVLAAVLPFALLGGLAWAATGAMRRRRREAVLS